MVFHKIFNMEYYINEEKMCDRAYNNQPSEHKLTDIFRIRSSKLCFLSHTCIVKCNQIFHYVVHMQPNIN